MDFVVFYLINILLVFDVVRRGLKLKSGVRGSGSAEGLKSFALCLGGE